MNTLAARTGAALLLQLTALVVLGAALLGQAWLDPRSKPRLLVLIDRSQSMPRPAADQALAEVERAAQAAGAADLQWIEFAGQPGALSQQAADALAPLQPSATHIEAALQAALAAHAQRAFTGAVMISDGLATEGDTARGLRAVQDAGLPLQWLAVGRPPPTTRIAQVLAPDRARAGQTLQIAVQLAGVLDKPLRLQASARAPGGETRLASGQAGSDGRVTIELDAPRPGAVVVDLRLEDPATGRTLDAMPDAAAIDVAPRAAVLYAQGSAGPLARSLIQGGWSLDVVPASRLDAQADGLDGYQAVVLDDVALADASPRFWRLLVQAVQHRGLGLLVLGGERSFARGGYRGSALETVLPVLSEPAALEPALNIVFAVDKSGSMGEGSGGVDRFALAQRAVLETARGLGARDAIGLLVFDVAPRLLLPLGPAPAGIRALERDWQASPNGGTRLAPALEAAIAELEHAAAGRRLLVLVTDGFIDNAPLSELRARLDRARIETIALAVGPDADVAALQRLVGTQAGLVLRVDQAAELPAVMQAGLERRRARVERGTIAVRQIQALPFSPGVFKDWPAITAHPVTRARPGASVVVQSQTGEPLIAFQPSGRGRVVAVTCGLGPWVAPWARWRGWPQLAGGLAAWVSGPAPNGAVGVTVSDLPGGLQVEVEAAVEAVGSARSDGAGTGGVSILVDTPTKQGLPLALDPVAPGRWRTAVADAGPGLYTVLASTPQGTQRQLHLRRERSENESWGTNPALAAWRSAGLIRAWDPAPLPHAPSAGPGLRPADRSLIGLALALFGAGVVVDRTRLTATGVAARVAAALRRWRAPAP
jgi:uncharacterized membrane protein